MELTDDELAYLHRMFDAAREGGTEQLADAVRAGVPVDLTNAAGDTLLLLAAYHAHPETVSMLLDLGADVSRVNDRGQTALGAAVFRRSEAGVRALLRAGADPRAGGRSAAEIADFFDLADMRALLEEDEPRRAPQMP